MLTVLSPPRLESIYYLILTCAYIRKDSDPVTYSSWSFLSRSILPFDLIESLHVQLPGESPLSLEIVSCIFDHSFSIQFILFVVLSVHFTSVI